MSAPKRMASGKDGIVLMKVFLDLDLAGNRIDDAGEHYSYAITHQLDNPPRRATIVGLRRLRRVA
jgi:hypothetical protein